MMPTAKEKAWSISRLGVFENCKRKYHHIHVLKDVTEDFSNEHAKYGKEAHKALERRVGDSIPLSNRFKQLEPVAAKIAAAKGKAFVEMQLCVNEKLQPTGWLDADAYCRAILDIMKVNGHIAWIGDYKTGKMKDDTDQLMLNALVTFAHFPDVDTVTSSFIWLKDDVVTKDVFHRKDEADLWSEILPRAQRIAASFDSGDWNPRPNGLCGYCPVKAQGKCDLK